jgi:hypothetical protein
VSGPAPKPANQRRRRNTVSTTHALTPVSADFVVPSLPDRVHMHPATIEFWGSLWASPMANEYDQSDLTGLYILATLIEIFWTMDPTRVKVRAELAGEIRLQRRAYGLDPMSRRSLQWSVEQVEAAQDSGRARRAKKGSDPRLSQPIVNAELV